MTLSLSLSISVRLPPPKKRYLRPDLTHSNATVAVKIAALDNQDYAVLVTQHMLHRSQLQSSPKWQWQQIAQPYSQLEVMCRSIPFSSAATNVIKAHFHFALEMELSSFLASHSTVNRKWFWHTLSCWPLGLGCFVQDVWRGSFVLLPAVTPGFSLQHLSLSLSKKVECADASQMFGLFFIYRIETRQKGNPDASEPYFSPQGPSLVIWKCRTVNGCLPTERF